MMARVDGVQHCYSIILCWHDMEAGVLRALREAQMLTPKGHTHNSLRIEGRGLLNQEHILTQQRARASRLCKLDPNKRFHPLMKNRNSHEMNTTIPTHSQ